MPRFDECCVLIPAATLEDFPSDSSDYDARSLLAAWSVLWHPSLLAQTGQTPVWYRADGPPDPIGSRLVTVPTPSIVQLPDGYEMRARQSDACRWITGESRAEMLEQLGLGDYPALTGEHRTVAVEDFFAAGFATLQIQVMTRRLRYTSNLDEIHLQNRIVDAAKSFLDGAAETAIEALHDVFDALAEERDHYFSSDPHLIDLTLTSKSTIDQLLAAIDESGSPPSTAQDSNSEPSALATPSNVLIDCEVAEAIGKLTCPRSTKLRELLSSGQIGWAGGGPATDVCLDAMTCAEAESVFDDAFVRTKDAIGSAPPVYGRFSGSTPSDMTRALAKLGYCGMIPIDFAHGTGHGDEAKVIMQSAGVKIEALTAKPIDASSDASFLTLGAKLGEAIDSGEIATALLAHWPGQTCDAFGDLRRVASWSLSLGRFWKLDEYFRNGEHPYHHGTARAASPDAAQLLEALIEQNHPDPISSMASSFRQSVIEECRGVMAGMTQLVTGKPIGDQNLASEFAAAVVGSAQDQNQTSESVLLINPHSVGCRDSVTMFGGLARRASERGKAFPEHIFATSNEGDESTTTVDIPACGFVVVQTDEHAKRESGAWGKFVRRKLFGGPAMIAAHGRLQNEFMEVTISADSGGISGVYSGVTRGNRCSMRLIRNSGADAKDCDTVMRCSDMRVTDSSLAVGCIETTGEIMDAEGKATLAAFTLRYTLDRGSRFLKVDGEVSPQTPVSGDPWSEYFAARVAVAGETAIYRQILRDKVHRARSRRLVAPLGVIIDEAERQTLVSAGGRAFHRRVGDRFLDTLLWIQGESNRKFTISYGFDVPSPVGATKTLIAPPIHVPIKVNPNVAEIGWIVHASPKDISISSLQVDRRRDGRLAAIVRVIQTRSQTCKASLRFFRDVHCALPLDVPSDDPLNQPLPDAEAAENESSKLSSDGDLVSLPIPAHGVADILVVFVSEASSS